MKTSKAPMPEDFAHCIHAQGWQVAWSGLLYVPGCRAGEDSAHALLRAMLSQGVGPGSCLGRGTYWLCVRSPEGTLHHMVDPCGLMRVFLASNQLFEHYSDALRSVGLTLETFDPAAVVEFLNYGRLGSNYTHAAAVTTLRGCDRVEIDGSGDLQVKDRCLADPMVHPGVTLQDGLRDLAYALQGHRVALDLTGGLDSRLLAVAFAHHGLTFEPGLSGADHYSEYAFAESVAEALGRTLLRYPHCLDNLDADLRRHAQASQGLMDVVATHRARCMQETRRAEGIEVAVGGMGGEMINDFTLLQDMPFLGRSRADLERFWRLRLLPLRMPEELLAEPYRSHQVDLPRRMLARLESFRRESAASTYLQIFYAHRMSAAAGAQLTASWRMGLCELAPLMDYDLYSGTYDLPMRERIASRHHRQYIKAHGPAVMGLPSSTGMPLHPGVWGEVRDVAGYGRQFVFRALRKFEQRLRRRRLRQESPDHPQLVAAVRQTDAARAGFARLQRGGILRPELTLEDVPDAWVGRVVSLGLCAALLD